LGRGQGWGVQDGGARGWPGNGGLSPCAARLLAALGDFGVV